MQFEGIEVADLLRQWCRVFMDCLLFFACIAIFISLCVGALFLVNWISAVFGQIAGGICFAFLVCAFIAGLTTMNTFDDE